MYEISGTVKVIEDEQKFPSGFNKREFVITTEDKFPQDIKLECTKDKVELVNKLRTGDKVNVSFNIRGNEYKGRYYVNLQAWKIEPAGDSTEGSEANSAPRGTSRSDVNLDDVEDSPF